MYSMVLMMAMAGAPEVPVLADAAGCHGAAAAAGCHGAQAGCPGAKAGCFGGLFNRGGCHGGGLFKRDKGDCHGAKAGCFGGLFNRGGCHGGGLFNRGGCHGAAAGGCHGQIVVPPTQPEKKDTPKAEPKKETKTSAEPEPLVITTPANGIIIENVGLFRRR